MAKNSLMDVFKDVKNSPSRNGFDLSKTMQWTCKIGELIPVYNRTCMPGDSFKIKIDDFVRTLPVETAAYTSFEINYDVFFVPYRLLYGGADASLSSEGVGNAYQRTTYNPSASSLKNSTLLPYFTVYDNVGYGNSAVDGSDINGIIQKLMMAYDGTGDKTLYPNRNKNIFGFSRHLNAMKLMHYLGYPVSFSRSMKYLESNKGNVSTLSEKGTVCYPNTLDGNSDSSKAFSYSPFPLLAYQKVWSDYYRNQQLYNLDTHLFNYDYKVLSGQSQFVFDNDFKVWFGSKGELKSITPFDLHYVQWQKDLFTAAMPNVLNSNLEMPDFGVTISDGDTIPVLRTNFARQKYFEIMFGSDTNSKDRIQKIYGVTPDNTMSDMSHYLGGLTYSMSVNEVLNTNLSDSSPDVRGVGRGNGQSREIEFSCREHGCIMIMAYVRPRLSYGTCRVAPDVVKATTDNFANPLADSIGYDPIRSYLFSIRNLGSKTSSVNSVFGYAPRYFDYKTDVDDVKGAFYSPSGYQQWVTPMTDNVVKAYQEGTKYLKTTSLSPYFNEVNPSFCDNIFGVKADDNMNTDCFLFSTDFNIRAIRPLSRTGLPY